MINPTYKILLIEPSREIQDLLSNILNANNYFVKVVNNFDDGIQLALKGKFNLIICQYKLKKHSGFQFFKELESNLIECGTSFFILSDKIENEEFIIGLEMGIDNFILTPINEKSLLKNIGTQRKKIHKANISEMQKFRVFFEYSPTALFVFENRQIIETNKAFKKLFNLDVFNGEELSFDTVFDLSEVSKNKMDFMKFENCLTDYCLLEKVKFVGKTDKYYTIFNHNIGNQKDYKFLGQVVLASSNSDEVEQNNSCPIYGTCLKIANNIHEYDTTEIHLTKRENEIFELSAKGLPIKQIASNLNLSQRTVEKHRANIMVKTDSRNFIETILAIQKNKFLHQSSLS